MVAKRKWFCFSIFCVFQNRKFRTFCSEYTLINAFHNQLRYKSHHVYTLLLIQVFLNFLNSLMSDVNNHFQHNSELILVEWGRHMFSLIAPYVIRWLEQKRLPKKLSENTPELIWFVDELGFAYVELVYYIRIIDAYKACWLWKS